MLYKSLILGVLFSIGVFALKSGVAAAYMAGRPQPRWARYLGIGLYGLGYALIFAMAAMILPRFDPLQHLAVVQAFIQSGMLVHLVMAGLMMGWGLLLLKQGEQQPTSSHGWLMLVVPCPVCITVILLSTGFLMACFPSHSWGLGAMLYALFMLLSAVAAVGVHRYGRFPFYHPQDKEHSMIDLGALLKTFIYLISASLLYPVLLLLVALTLVIIVSAGAFLAEWLERVRLKPCAPQALPQLLKSGQAAAAVTHRVNRYLRSLQQIRRADPEAEAIVENLLQQTTLRLWKTMDRLRILVRAAPSLGLIGTLILMGTGLAALGQGDMTRLTTDLVIAFTTTVVGLAIGTTAFCLYTVRRRWIEEDIKNMELATELLMCGEKGAAYEVLNAAANQ